MKLVFMEVKNEELSQSFNKRTDKLSIHASLFFANAN